MKLTTRTRVTVADWLLRLSCLVYPVGASHTEAFSKPSTAEEPEAKPSRGRVVQVTAPAEYDFEKASRPRKGGRVVKLMPRQLKKVKEGQEKPLNEDS